MSSAPAQSPPTRFVALDMHRDYLVVGAVDAQQAVVMPPQSISFGELDSWARMHLQPTDAVVLASMESTWRIHDQLVGLVNSVTIAHPQLVKMVGAASSKTDAHDPLTLARLLAAGLVPSLWVPPPEVRALRTLAADWHRLITRQREARTRLRSVLARHLGVPLAADLFAAPQSAAWEALDLVPTERRSVNQDLALLDRLPRPIAEVEAELTRLSATDPWSARVQSLVQLPGIKPLNAMILLAAIGAITRFSSAEQLVGYSGLSAGHHDLPSTHQRGHSTMPGRRELRTAMIQIARSAVQQHSAWQTEFDHLAARIGKSRAIVAVARKLLVVVWQSLTDHEVSDHMAGLERCR